MLLLCRLQVKSVHATCCAHASVVLCAVCAPNSVHVAPWNQNVGRSQVISSLCGEQGPQSTKEGSPHVFFHLLLLCRPHLMSAHTKCWVHAGVVLSAVCGSNSTHVDHWKPNVGRFQLKPSLHGAQMCLKHQGRQSSPGLATPLLYRPQEKSTHAMLWAYPCVMLCVVCTYNSTHVTSSHAGTRSLEGSG